MLAQPAGWSESFLGSQGATRSFAFCYTHVYSISLGFKSGNGARGKPAVLHLCLELRHSPKAESFGFIVCVHKNYVIAFGLVQNSHFDFGVSSEEVLHVKYYSLKIVQ